MTTTITPTFKVGRLQKIFEKTKERLIPETEAQQRNLTNTFYEDIRDTIQTGELLVLSIRGPVRKGKSTVGLALQKQFNKYIKELGYNNEPYDKPDRFVFSDQTEFLRFINGDDRQAVLLIDEYNKMGETGLNATTETALYDHYTDVFAAQYLHRILCRPDEITDKNTNIILDVLSRDPNTRITRCKLIYRDIITKLFTTIGYVDINVGPIIHIWETSGVKKLIEFKTIHTPQEQQLITEAQKKDHYVRYQVKKYRRMDLLKKHGVRDIRYLEFADIILQIIDELENYSMITKPDQKLVNTFTEKVTKANKRIYSIIVGNEVATQAHSILNLNYQIQKLMSQREKNAAKLKPDEKTKIDATITQLKQYLQEIIREQRKYSLIYRDYLKIE